MFNFILQFTKESYYRFLNGEIKSISRGKYSRENEGLYIHHITEINHPNLANRNYIGHLSMILNIKLKIGWFIAIYLNI